ncbi:MAG: AEC family transporter [Chloroflexota bacterium]
MILLTIFLNILLPVFALVILGYVAGPRLALDARSLSRFAYYLVAPSFIFNVFSQSNIEVTLAVRMILFMLTVTLLTALGGYLAARLLRASPTMTSAFVLIAGFGNVGNFGFPIIQFKFGDEALAAAALYFIIGSISGFMIGVMAATWHKGESRLVAVMATLKTPALIAVVPAFIVNYFGLPLPIFVTRSVGLLAGALIPIMLVTLGVQLAEMGRPRLTREIIVASSLRLIVGPVLAMLLAPVFVVTGIERGAGVLQAAMPAAVLTALIAWEHDLMPDVVTMAVLLSTVASAVTLTLVLALV